MGISEEPARIRLSPFRRRDGYLPIEDHGLIGDGATAALVGRDGAVCWRCVPRFDAPPLFCAILDAARGGGFRISPDGAMESGQAYIPESGVLVTELRSASGRVRITDAMTFRSGADLNEDDSPARGELLRIVEGIEGTVRLQIAVEPRGGAEAERHGGGLRLRCRTQPHLKLHLLAGCPLGGLHTVRDLRAGERLSLALRWRTSHRQYPQAPPEELLERTVEVWRRWLRCFDYEGPQRDLVLRSAITLKLLDHVENGAIVAAPTSSLPERVGGIRNWDYRFSWLRDAAFSVYALRRIGMTREAWKFLAWVLDAVDRDGRPEVLYTLDGDRPEPESEDHELEGYRGSRPVRWSNAAAAQRQHDVFGEILDCAYQWSRGGGRIDPPLWEHLCRLVELARCEWEQLDHGIWEVRTSPSRPFSYSTAMCQVALDRAASMAERFSLPGDVPGWRDDAAKIAQAILDEAWNPSVNSLTGQLGGEGVDASLLSLRLRRVVSAHHPRMIATTAAVADRLGASGGLIYRYLPEESPDGLPRREGAFLLCSFWLADNLALQGRLDEAMVLYDSLCARANPLGLLPEQVEPSEGSFLGNYPQAFSHVGLISSGVNLFRLMKKKRRSKETRHADRTGLRRIAGSTALR